MPDIHPTTILDGNISLADDVAIGPHSVLMGDISIGSGLRLIGNCYLAGTLDIGENNTVYPFVSIGFTSQDINFPYDQYEPGIKIGNNNVFREGTTVHQATQGNI